MTRRLLYLFPSTTHPVTNGAQVRASALLRHFAADLGWEVDFFCPQGSRAPSAWGENAALLRAIHLPGDAQACGGALRRLAAFRERARRVFPAAGARHGGTRPAHPSCVSSRMRRYAEKRLVTHVTGLIRRNAYDAVLVSYVWMSPLVERFLGRRGRPLMVLDTIDIQYVRESRLTRFREGDPSDLVREKGLELSIIGNYDVVIAITRHDEALLRRELPGARLCTVEVECPPSAGRHPGSAGGAWTDQPYDLVFLGADNEANRLAVRQFNGNLFPRLRQAVPSISVAIGGKVAEAAEIRREVTHPAVRLVGYVPSATEFIGSGRIFVAPIVAGGGVKVKILEAMACGVPVVTTPLGAEGIGCEDGVDCLIAGNDEDFVRGVVGLMDSPARRSELAGRARERLRARTAEGAVYRECDRILREALP